MNPLGHTILLLYLSVGYFMLNLRDPLQQKMEAALAAALVGVAARRGGVAAAALMTRILT